MPSPVSTRRMRALAGGLLGLALTLVVLRPALPASAGADFSGAWRLDPSRSDNPTAAVQAAAGPAQVKGGGTNPLTILPSTGARKSVERVELRDWLLGLAAQLDHLEIEQTADTIKLFHGEDLARTFYFAREHVRQDGQGRKLKCKTRWEGSKLLLVEEGDKGRKVIEELALDPSDGRLVHDLRMEDRLLEKPIVMHLVYARPEAGATSH